MDYLLSCYFPTKVVVVDDDENVLKGIKSLVNHKVATYDFFTDQRQALEVISQSKPTDYIDYPSNQEKFYELHRLIYHPDRHQEISTVIVDYEMPGINGLEFCEKIKNPYIRKILYTGAADEDIAIKAFNKGLIDGYIRKQDPDTGTTVNNFIQTSQHKYFKKLTEVLVERDFKEIMAEDPTGTAFFDPVFIKYFYDLVQKHQICEYYIHERTAGFICLSAKGEKSTLFTFTKETFQDNQIVTYDLIKELSVKDKIKYAKILEEIDQDKKTICLPCYGEYVDVNVDNWTKFVHSYEVIEGSQPYYLVYASHAHLGKDPNIYSFEECRRSR